MLERTLIDQRHPAVPAQLRRIRAALREALEELGCDEADCDDLVLAVDEACQNVIRHAYRGAAGEIRLQLSQVSDRVVVTVSDDAPASPQDVLHRGRSLDVLRPGGLGTHFMQELMDEVSLSSGPRGHGNCLRMVKRLAGVADPSS